MNWSALATATFWRAVVQAGAHGAGTGATVATLIAPELPGAAQGAGAAAGALLAGGAVALGHLLSAPPNSTYSNNTLRVPDPIPEPVIEPSK